MKINAGGEGLLFRMSGMISGWTKCRTVLSIVLIVFFAGLWIAKKSGEAVDLQMRRDLVQQAVSIATALNPLEIKELSFTADDQSVRGFQRIREQLSAYAETVGLQRLYTTALHDGHIVFGPSNLSDGHLSVPPGTVYPVRTQKDLDVFETARPQIYGPFKAEFGQFVTASAPVIDPATGKVLMAVGIDVEAKDWRAAVRHEQMVPGTVTLVLLLMLFGGLIICSGRRTIQEADAGWVKYIEVILCAVFLLALSMALAAHVYRLERESRRNMFYSLAQIQASSCLIGLHDLGVMLDQIVCFFESSDQITRQEFSSYCKRTMQSGAMSACLWIPAVPVELAGTFEQQIHREGFPDLFIWQNNAAGFREPVEHRPVYYPVQYIEPASYAARLGYDLNSEPVHSSAIRQAIDSGRSVATDPLSFFLQKNSLSGLLIYKAVTDSQQKGLVAFAVRSENLLGRNCRDGKKTCDLKICLSLLQRGRFPVMVADTVDKFGPECWTSNESQLGVTVPVFLFGHAYALRLMPERSWLEHHPLNDGWIALLGGLLITLLVSLVVVLITNRRLALEKLVARRTEELEKSEQHFRAVTETIPDLVWLKDPDGIYLSCNPRFELLYGAARDEIVGKTDYDFVSRDLADFFRAKDRIAMEKGGPSVNEEWLTFAADGHKELVETIKTPMLDRQGRLIGVLGIGRNITARKQAEEAVLEQRKLADQYLQIAGIMICALNPSGECLLINKKGLEILGYADESEILGKNWFDVTLPMDRVREVKHVFDQIISGNITPVEYHENPLKTKTGEERLMAFHNAVLRDKDDRVTGVIFSGEDITERRASEERIRQLAQHLETVREEERKRLSRELHDDIGQILTALKIDLLTVHDGCTCQGDVKEKMDDMQHLLGDGIRSVHSLCRQLRPGALDDLGLEDALEGLLEDWKVRNQVDCRLNVKVEDPLLSDMIKTTVFRAVQEALTNISRHAAASHVDIHLTEDNQILHLLIIDDGCGMKAGSDRKPDSFGLLGMHERIEALGGTLSIASTQGRGTRIEAVIPLES